MILIVALNPALDITHEVPSVDWSGVNRPTAVHARPGGKGLNVARTLRAIGDEVLVLGLAGGVTGQSVQSALGELGIPAALTPIRAETRRTFAVVDGARGGTALFNEPGPAVEADEYAGFCVTYKSALAGSAAVVLSGSLPQALPAQTYAELVGVATAAGVPVVLDAHGAALVRGAAAGPAVVKPNLAELEAIAGRSLTAPDGGADRGAVARAAAGLRASGPEAVVVSLGADGLLAITPAGSWLAAPPADVTGNPTGAGDAVTAGLVHGLVAGQPWAERLRHAVALGTASAAAPVAGEFRQADYTGLLPRVTVRRSEAS
ncbi:MAG: 1-phosphofructokinase family hexose kinase [Actinomycetota bacterium]